jgi:hypothetical protein
VDTVAAIIRIVSLMNIVAAVKPAIIIKVNGLAME